MTDESERSSNELLLIIERGALKDIDNIDVTALDQSKINIATVKDWYIESEKVIRIMANILPSTMAQPINQLRYAGHHILKHCCNEVSDGSPELVEAYKHCKRAYYDALDLYIYDMNDIYRVRIALLASGQDDYNKKLGKHLNSINQLRIESESRIDYYKGVQDTLSQGLSLIAAINTTLFEQGITKEVLKEKQVLIEELNKARKAVALQSNVIDTALEKLDAKNNRKLTWIGLSLAVVTALGITFQGFFTEILLDTRLKHSVEFENILDVQLNEKVNKGSQNKSDSPLIKHAPE